MAYGLQINNPIRLRLPTITTMINYLQIQFFRQPAIKNFFP